MNHFFSFVLAAILVLCLTACDCSEEDEFVFVSPHIGPASGNSVPNEDDLGTIPAPDDEMAESSFEFSLPEPVIRASIKSFLQTITENCEQSLFLTFDEFQTEIANPPSALETVRVNHSETKDGGLASYPIVRYLTMSADGTTIAFIAESVNLAFDSTNRPYFPERRQNPYLYVRDVVGGTTRLIDVEDGLTDPDRFFGGINDGIQDSPISLSADGRYLAYIHDGNLFRLDLTNDQRLTVPTGPDPFIQIFNSFYLYADGNTIIFTGIAGLDSGNPSANIYTYEFSSNTLTGLVTGGLRERGAGAPVSADGRFITYRAVGAGDPSTQVYLLDVNTGISTRLSNNLSGGPANAVVFDPIISADGSFVVFETFANNLVVEDSNNGFDLFGVDVATGQIELLTIRSDGSQPVATNERPHPQVSGDGRYVVFRTLSDGFTPEDTNGKFDLFIRDRVAGTTELISVNSNGEAQDGRVEKRYIEEFPPDSFIECNHTLSTDGRFLAYCSNAENLVTNDRNKGHDVFRLDRQNGVVTMESVRTDGQQMFSPGLSQLPVISGDGAVIAFNTVGDQIVDVPPELIPLFFEGVPIVRKLPNDEFEFLLVKDDGSPFADPSDRVAMFQPTASLNGLPIAISDSGDSIVFLTCEKLWAGDEEPNVSPRPNICNVDTFVYRRQDKVSEPVSISADGSNGTISRGRSISGDGKLVSFFTTSTKFDPADISASEDIYVRDRSDGCLTLQSIGLDGNVAGSSTEGKLSGDGKFLGFQSSANSLDPQERNISSEIFVRNISDGRTCRVTELQSGDLADGDSYLNGAKPLSTQGRYIVFASDASNLVIDDNNGVRDIFLLDRAKGERVRLSLGGSGEANGASNTPSLSGDGRFVVFSSKASNLVEGDNNSLEDIFLFDRLQDEIALVSRNRSGEPGNGPSKNPDISRDGRFIVFSSRASDLVEDDTNMVADVFRVRNPFKP